MLNCDCPFKVTDLIEKSQLPWRKAYESLEYFIVSGLVQKVPCELPEDWGTFTTGERKRYRIENGLPLRGKTPVLYTVNHEELINRLKFSYKRTIEDIETQAQADKNQQSQFFSSIFKPLKGIVGTRCQTQFPQLCLEGSNE
jgi:hypothetical protein